MRITGTIITHEPDLFYAPTILQSTCQIFIYISTPHLILNTTGSSSSKNYAKSVPFSISSTCPAQDTFFYFVILTIQAHFYKSHSSSLGSFINYSFTCMFSGPVFAQAFWFQTLANMVDVGIMFQVYYAKEPG
jgi:hypothetical protein